MTGAPLGGNQMTQDDDAVWQGAVKGMWMLIGLVAAVVLAVAVALVVTR